MKKWLSLILIGILALTLTAGLALADEAEDMDEIEEADEEFDVSQWLQSVLNEAYMGVMDDGTTAYFAFGETEDEVIGALVFMDAAQAQSASFVGPYADNGDGTLTIEDYWNGLSMTVGVEAAEDGFYIDLGDLGSGAVAPVSIDEIIEAFIIIQEGTDAAA